MSHMSAHVADELASHGDPTRRVVLIDGHVLAGILRTDDDPITCGGHVQRTEGCGVGPNLRPGAIPELVHARDGLRDGLL